MLAAKIEEYQISIQMKNQHYKNNKLFWTSPIWALIPVSIVMCIFCYLAIRAETAEQKLDECIHQKK